MPRGIVTETWMHPRTAADFACQWHTEVAAARRLGRRVGGRYLEVRYESLVDDVEAVLRRICEFARLEYEADMVDYAGNVDVSAKPHQQRLTEPPTKGVRDWRAQMSADDVAAFEHVAGDLLRELGYETSHAADAAGRVRLASYASRALAWRGASFALRRSSLWRRRHPPLRG
jgi:hypothetical protein